MATHGQSHPQAPQMVERHRADRTGWLRAAVLGANDGLVSTASLMMGVAAASPERLAVLTAGLAGLAAGALSMAAGEYVSVASQRDTERADLARERDELERFPEAEERELAGLYRKKGVSPALAVQVARELMAGGDRLAVHAREELGLDVSALARPVQAAVTSATSFALGAAIPVVAMLLAPAALAAPAVVVTTLVFLAGLGALGAQLGAAPRLRAAARVLVGGGAAMAITALVGRLVSVAL